MEVTNYWPPLPCQGKLQVQQVTCGLVVLSPHPGDNLLMEIEPKYIYKVPLNISLAGGETTRET